MKLLPVQGFYEKLASLNIRKNTDDVPNLTNFLACQNNVNYIDMKKLEVAFNEFNSSTQLKSFGMRKER